MNQDKIESLKLIFTLNQDNPQFSEIEEFLTLLIQEEDHEYIYSTLHSILCNDSFFKLRCLIFTSSKFSNLCRELGPYLDQLFLKEDDSHR